MLPGCWVFQGTPGHPSFCPLVSVPPPCREGLSPGCCPPLVGRPLGWSCAPAPTHGQRVQGPSVLWQTPALLAWPHGQSFVLHGELFSAGATRGDPWRSPACLAQQHFSQDLALDSEHCFPSAKVTATETPAESLRYPGTQVRGTLLSPVSVPLSKQGNRCLPPPLPRPSAPPKAGSQGRKDRDPGIGGE